MKAEPSQQSLKSSLRKEMRQRRAELGREERQRLDRIINDHLVDTLASSELNVIAAYMAFDGEPDLTPALERLEQGGKRLVLPVIHSEPGRAAIDFRHWTPDCAMQTNRYGILEPVGTEEAHMPEIDLALIPLVAWDPAGGRLGMGASFYDRLFQPFARLARPERIGVAYDLQCVEHLPREPWDVSMHGFLTESGYRRAGESRK